MDVLNLIGTWPIVALVVSQVVLGLFAGYLVSRQTRKTDQQNHREAA